ncbi:MAG: hypothetical protein ACUVXJ_13565, partial [Phycisphaerae bacterium]
WSQIPIWDPRLRRFPSSLRQEVGQAAGPGVPSGTTTSTIPIVIQHSRWSRIPIRWSRIPIRDHHSDDSYRHSA